MQKQPEKDNLPGNYPRFSSISNHNEASTNQSTRFSTGFRGDNSFLGIGRKTEGLSATNRTNDEDIASQHSCMIDENSVNEIVNKELQNERELILNYVNTSLNDNTNHMNATCSKLQGDLEKRNNQADKEFSLMHELMTQIKDTFRGELENLNVRMTKLMKDQSTAHEQNLQKLSERFLALENQNKISNKHQVEDPEIGKLNREIDGIRAKLDQIIQTSESKKQQADQSQQISDLNLEIQAIKTSITSFKQDWEPKAQDIHESTKQMLLNAVGQDKQIDKQIEDIQRYMFGFQTVFQHKLSITSEDLKLFMDSQESFKKNTPFSFGGDMNILQTEPISTLGTTHSAEFEVQDGNKLFMKKKESSNKSAPFQESTTTITNKQGFQPTSSNTNIASQIPSISGGPSSGRNSLNADYYNIYNDGARAQPSVSSKAPFMEASSQNPKKKKRIFGEDSYSGSNSWGNQSMRTLEQKNNMPFQYGTTGQTHFQSTEPDQVRYETISNKETLQESQEFQVNAAALESKLSVKVNDSNFDIFEEASNLSGSDSESTYSNFRLKDTKNFVQREFPTTSGVNNQEQSLSSVDPTLQKPSLNNNNNNSNTLNSFAPQYNKDLLFSQEPNNNTAFSDRNTKYPLSIPSQSATIQQFSSQEPLNHNQIPAAKINSPFEYSAQDKLQCQQLKTIFECELEQSAKPSDFQIASKIDNFMLKSKGSLNKQIISGQALNFMIASKGKKVENPLEHNYNEEASKLNGVALNDFAEDFKPKWGYDSQVSEASFKEEIEYQLDEEGFLLDQNGQILLDDNGEKIKLSEDHIRYLQQNQMIQDV